MENVFTMRDDEEADLSSTGKRGIRRGRERECRRVNMRADDGSGEEVFKRLRKIKRGNPLGYVGLLLNFWKTKKRLWLSGVGGSLTFIIRMVKCKRTEK